MADTSPSRDELPTPSAYLFNGHVFPPRCLTPDQRAAGVPLYTKHDFETMRAALERLCDLKDIKLHIERGEGDVPALLYYYEKNKNAAWDQAFRVLNRNTSDSRRTP